MRFAHLILAAWAICLAIALPANAWTDPMNPGAERLEVRRGQSAVVEADGPFATIIVADPEIAEAMATSNRSFFLRGLTPGTTTVLIYNALGAVVELIDVDVTIGLDGLRADLKHWLPDEQIDVYPLRDGVYLDGRVSTAEAAEMAQKIAEYHVPDVTNGLVLGEARQVVLEVRFLEASRSALRELGFGNEVSLNATISVNGSEPVLGSAEESIALFTHVSGGSVDTEIRALEAMGIIRTLAEPNLVTLSGDTATFLAGGEFPIPMASADNEITVEFTKFGVGLDFTPSVLDNAFVNLRVRPEVSALDRASGILTSNIEVPGISVRRADTTVELRAGQPIALAGLLQHNFSNDARQTPWLGKLPILGTLFSSKRFQRGESELLVTVTPRLTTPPAYND